MEVVWLMPVDSENQAWLPPSLMWSTDAKEDRVVTVALVPLYTRFACVKSKILGSGLVWK